MNRLPTNIWDFLKILPSTKKTKEQILTEISRRAIILGSTRLNYTNFRTAFNGTCASLINYTTGVIEWTQNELAEINKLLIKTLKIMNYQDRFLNVDRIFLGKALGGMGFRDIPLAHNSQLLKMK